MFVLLAFLSVQEGILLTVIDWERLNGGKAAHLGALLESVKKSSVVFKIFKKLKIVFSWFITQQKNGKGCDIAVFYSKIIILISLLQSKVQGTISYREVL